MARHEEYDEKDVHSIVEYAHKLVGHSLREKTNASKLDDPHRRKGAFGNAVEEYYFHYAPNSDSAPDFSEAGLELKCTPLKRTTKGDLVAKERLVLSMIDYMSVVNETFETSHLMEKIDNILLISYLWEKDVDLLDYKVVLADVWSIPPEDVPQIKADWETVVNKVRSGHAEDISGSDTAYLEACTKSANSKVRRSQPFSSACAKPRAWAFKASYMTSVQNHLLENAKAIGRSADEGSIGLLELVRRRFEPFFGLTEAELAKKMGVSCSKDRCARITKRILGIGENEQIAEFVKAGIEPKTIRLKKNGKPKEPLSFRAFNYYDLEEREFEDSDFYSYLQNMYLFVLYREDQDGAYRLSDICFWQMSDDDLDEAKACYDQMRENVREGLAIVSVRSTENRCCFVKTHGRDSKDTCPQPHGKPVPKKSFWLNANYIADEIAKALGR